jgi:hypothetical protein
VAFLRCPNTVDLLLTVVIPDLARSLLNHDIVGTEQLSTRETTIVLVYLASAIATAIEVFGVNPAIAKIFDAGFGWNFISRYFWIFRP